VLTVIYLVYLHDIGILYHLQRCAFMTFLSPGFLSRGFPHLRDLFQPVAGGGLVTVAAVFLQLLFHRTQTLVYLLKVLLKDLDVALKNSDRILKIFHQRNDCFRTCFVESNDLLPRELVWGFSFPSHYHKYIKELIKSLVCILSYTPPPEIAE